MGVRIPSVAPITTMSNQTYLPWQIEECIEILTLRAKETGASHNAVMLAKNPNWVTAPLAWQACHSWHAVEIIRELQADLQELLIEHKRVKAKWHEDYELLDDVCRHNEALRAENAALIEEIKCR